jgi:hypothetical protein
MTRRDYIDAALRLYIGQPDTPAAPSRADWTVAADLYSRGVDLKLLAHAIRLATLRRSRRSEHAPPLEPIHSFSYYRQVLLSLSPQDREPAYIDYVENLYQRLAGPLQPEKTADRSKTAVTPPEYRGF